jgi:predicted O-methyltransferase YrrM
VSFPFKFTTYLNYWLDAVNEHSLHSPLLFDLYTTVINAAEKPIPAIEKLRVQLLNDTRTIVVNDLGTGSKHFKNNNRKISDIARTSLSDSRFSSLYLRLIQHAKAKNIIELGTSFGINTLYLAQQEGSKVFSFEGSDAIADIAELTFEFGRAKNVELLRGNIDTTLYAALSRMPKADFIFMDANHRYEATLKYFEWLLTKVHHTTIMVIDDIYDNPGMAKAWKEIKQHDLVYMSVDLYRCGILFFDPSLVKQHVVLQF